MFVLTVPSADKTKTYTLRKVEDVWTCDCQDHLNRSRGQAYVCKHIAELVMSLAFVTGAPRSKKAEEILSA